MRRTPATRIGLVAVATAVVLASGTAVAPARPTAEWQPLPGERVTRLVTFGHSWVRGRYPDPQVVPWPERVAAAQEVALSNRGVNGAESPQIAEAVAAYEAVSTDEVVIAPMLNDVRAHGIGGLARFRVQVRRMLDRLAAGPTVPARVMLLIDASITRWEGHPEWYRGYDQGSDQALAAYARTLRAVASRPGYRRGLNLRVVDLRIGWDPSVDVGPDGLHPGEAGTGRIARAVRRALRAMRFG